MWLWIVVAVAAVMHAAVISDEENRRIRNAKEEIFVKYSRIRYVLKKRRRGRLAGSCFPLLFSFLPISPARDGMPGWNI